MFENQRIRTLIIGFAAGGVIAYFQTGELVLSVLLPFFAIVGCLIGFNIGRSEVGDQRQPLAE